MEFIVILMLLAFFLIFIDPVTLGIIEAILLIAFLSALGGCSV